MRNKRQRKLKVASLIAFFSALFYVVVVSTIVFICIANTLYEKLNPSEIPFIPNHIQPYLSILVCLLAGSLITAFCTREILFPLYKICDAIDKISDGDYSVHIKPRGLKLLKRLGDKINHMVEEINSVEILRNDFVNNFSHEFKTPIISIEGFAKVVRYDNLTKAERDEYLDIIISESGRLAELSSNILNLSRIEQQTILTHQKQFNVTEQIRLVIALLDQKWADKNIGVDFDCPEINITGNEELLKQLWINLLDNAYKFSPDGSVIRISIEPSEDTVLFTIADQGCGMNEEDIKRAFDKFYQGDLSHSTKGNGIGLPMAKKISELHSGDINIKPGAENGTVFEVSLPLEN